VERYYNIQVIIIRMSNTSEEMSTSMNAIDAVTEGINRVGILDSKVQICANCGKEGSDITNTCNKCESVMYCNAACKKTMQHVRKNTGINIRKSVRDELLSYMMNNFLNDHNEGKIVQSASYDCRHLVREGSTWHVVVRLYAVDVFAHLSMITKETKLKRKLAHCAEPPYLLQIRSRSKGLRSEWN